MPAENERKYVLSFNLAAQDLEEAGWKKIPIRQAYLPDGPRVRQYGDQYVFTYKRWIAAKNRDTEVETALSEEDFNDLWKECKEVVSKTRYIAPDMPDGYEWAVDFLQDKKDKTYFIMAEVEMPEHIEKPEKTPSLVAANIMFEVPKGDFNYSNKKLSNKRHAKKLLQKIKEYQDKGTGYSAPEL